MPSNDGSDPRVTRREMLSSTLAAGFALAVQPVSAQTITTPSTGLTAGPVEIPVADGRIPGYRAMPASGHSLPLILVVHEIFGVHEHIRDVCRRLARLGYCAVAPELFARQGDVSQLQDYAEIRKIVNQASDSQVMGDLDATVAWARSTGAVDGRSLGITGFCWGGRITWLYAAHNSQLHAAVAWYGALEGQPTANQPQYPIDVVAELKAPVLGLYGGKDEGISDKSVTAMRVAINDAKRKAMIVTYPNAGHAFFADYRPTYRADAAADGWRRAIQWFKDNGLDPKPPAL